MQELTAESLEKSGKSTHDAMEPQPAGSSSDVPVRQDGQSETVSCLCVNFCFVGEYCAYSSNHCA